MASEPGRVLTYGRRFNTQTFVTDFLLKLEKYYSLQFNPKIDTSLTFYKTNNIINYFVKPNLQFRLIDNTSSMKKQTYKETNKQVRILKSTHLNIKKQIISSKFTPGFRPHISNVHGKKKLFVGGPAVAVSLVDL